MSTSESIAIVLEAFRAVEERDEERLLELYHPEVEFHWTPSLPFGGSSQGGRAAPGGGPTWSEVWSPLQPTEAERRMDPRVVAATEREVVVLWRQRAVSPGGERFDGEVLGVYEVRDGKFARAQMFYFDAIAAQRFIDSAGGAWRAPSRSRQPRRNEAALTGQHVDGTSRQATDYRRLSEPAYRGAFVEFYDRLRPAPPAELISLLRQLAPAQPPRLVVDLGSGTGISTIVWAAHADRVIGIEQNPEMVAAARQAPNVEYRLETAQQTALPDACAEVVTCAQSFHWMDHRSTIAEIARILRPGGIFAAYDYDWPPLVDWEVDAAFLAVISAGGVDPARPEKARHLERLRESGRFRWVRELCLHKRELGDAERIAMLPLAFGPVARRLNEGASEEELGLTRLRQVVERRIGARKAALWWSYRVRAACK